MFQVIVEPFVINFTQIVDIDNRPWSMGEIGDWIWSVEDFNTTWGIENDLSEAIARSKQAIVNLQDDFNLTCEQVISEKYHVYWDTSTSENVEF
jgi:hypothetical protein